MLGCPCGQASVICLALSFNTVCSSDNEVKTASMSFAAQLLVQSSTGIAMMMPLVMQRLGLYLA